MRVEAAVERGRSYWLWSVAVNGRAVVSGYRLTKGAAEREADLWLRVIGRTASDDRRE